MDKLTPRQAAFARAYAADPERNAARAARTAGYKVDGHPHSAGQRGSEIMKLPAVRAEIARLTMPAIREAEITVDRITRELTKIALAKLTRSSTIRPGDKLKALELLGRHLKMFGSEGPDAPSGVVRLIIMGAGPKRVAQAAAIDAESRLISGPADPDLPPAGHGKG